MGSLLGRVIWRSPARKSMDLTAEWVARTNGTYVSNRIEMQEAPKDMPLLGLFSISHMDFMADPGRDQDQPTLTK